MTDRRHRAFQQYAGDPEKYQLSSACKNAETEMDSSYFFLMDNLMSIKWVIRSDDASAGILELILDRSSNNKDDVWDFKTYELDSSTTMIEPVKDASLVPAADTVLADQMAVADTNQPDDAEAADLHISPAAAAEATVSGSTLVAAAGTPADLASTATADGKRDDPATIAPSARKLALFLLFILVTFQCNLCSGKKLFVGDQCLSFLRETRYSIYSCYDLMLMSREKVSSKCCHPDELLHCQEEDGTGILELAGCSKGQDVSPGHYSRLVNIGDALQLQIHPCAKDRFEDNFRKSSSLFHPFCTRPKSSCKGIGEEKHCFGGTTWDDLCRCKTDFEPSSPDCLTFNDTSMCTCKPVRCDAGTVQMPLANMVGNCSIANHLSESNYSCVPSASTKPPIPTGSTSHESSFGPHENSTSSRTSHPPALTPSNFNFVAVFVPLGILILIVILLVVAWQYRNVLLNSFWGSFLARVWQCMGQRLNTNGSQHGMYIYDPVNQNVVGV